MCIWEHVLKSLSYDGLRSINRPFPVRAMYAWNVCVGVQLLLSQHWSARWLRNGWRLYTNLYGAYEKYSDTFSICVAISVYRTTAWPCLPSWSKHALWKDKDSARIGTSVGELQTHKQGLLRRKRWPLLAQAALRMQLLCIWKMEILREILWRNPWKPRQSHNYAGGLCVTGGSRLSSPCLCVCSLPTPVPILLESLSFHRACLDEDGKQGQAVVRYTEIATQTLKVSLYFS